MGLFVSIQIPAVQTMAVAKVTEILSKAINFPVSIESVNISWLNTVRLEKVRLVDNHGKDMITVQKLDASFHLLSFFNGKNIVLSEAVLDSANVSLILDEKSGDLNMDEFVRRLRRLGSPSSDTTPSKSFPFIIKSVTLKNSHFSYFDEEEKEFRKGFDHFHFGFKNIEIQADSFKINRDTIEMNVRHLSGIETSSGLPIISFKALYRMTDLDMVAQNLSTDIGHTHISNSLKFKYSEIYSLSSFLDSVTLDLDLNDTKISTDDLAQFAPELANFNQVWTVSGKFKGKVGDFNAQKLNLRFGKSSIIKGNIDIKGLPDFYNTFSDLNFKNSIIYAEDLSPFLDKNSLAFIKKLGKISVTGNFLGFPKDFVYSGSFISDLGFLQTDLNLKLNGIEKTFYEGKVKAQKFQLGKLLGQEDVLKTIDMNGSIEGTGFNFSTLKMKAEADIHQIELLGYSYKNTKVDASLAKNFFNGNLSIKDTNLIANFSGSIDATLKPEKINLNFDIKHANLSAIHILENGLNISAKGDLDFTGLIQNETEGNLKFTDITLEKDGNTSNLDELIITSEISKGLRNININSDWISANVQGDFLIKTLLKEGKIFVNELGTSFKNDPVVNTNYYKNRIVSIPQSIVYNIKLNDLNPVLQLFKPDIFISKNTILEGIFNSGKKYEFEMNCYSDALKYKDKIASKDTIKVFLSKNTDNHVVIGNSSISINRINWDKSLVFQNLYNNANWNDNIIEFKTGTKQRDYNNSIDFGGLLTLFDTKTELKITDSEINILNKKWTISDSNQIVFIPNSIIFKNINLNEGKQNVSLNGTLNSNPLEPLLIKIQNFDLATLNSLITYQLKGTLNGDIAIKDLYNNLSLNNQLSCDSLYIDNFLFGNLTASSSWDNFLQKIIITADLERGKNFVANIAGQYDPKDKISPINLNVNLNKVSISLIEPFVKDILSSLKGNASGILDIDGTFEKPIITGVVKIDDGQMKVNYLNSTYSFTDNFYFKKDFFGFQNCAIIDENKETGLLDGGIYHNFFRDMRLDLDGKVNKFQILNTSEKDNDIFYGTGIASGDFSLRGPFNNILIKANLRTDLGTRLFLPLDRKESVTRKDFITFVSRIQKDSLAAKKENIIARPDSSRIKLDFDIEMTKNAYCEIIFDKKSGDIIRGYGSGLLRLNMDTKGEFTMFGDYTISQGAYNFTMLNIINKGFTIKPGSHLTWTGDPVNAQLDVTASYTQNVLLTPILPIDTATFNRNSAFSRRYPTTINLNLRGNLLKPDISYGIEIKEYPTNIDNYPVDLYVKAFLAYVQSNEQEMNKQVFSLLVLKSFLSNTDSRFTNLSQSAFGSVSELISNQLNNWLSQVDENLQIDIDLNGLDRNALNAMRMRLSYSLLQGRLRITRDGGFTNTRNQSSTYSVLGEWTVEYLLTKDGILRLKMFNKNNPNAGVTALDANSNGFAGGFSLLHTQSFDNLNDLFKRKDQEEKKKQKALEKLNKEAIMNEEKKEVPPLP